MIARLALVTRALAALVGVRTSRAGSRLFAVATVAAAVIAGTAAAAGADRPVWTVSPQYPNVGDMVTVTLSWTDANPSNQLDIYYETPGHTGCAMLRPDEAARQTATAFIDQTFGAGPYAYTGSFRADRQGDYLLCAYIYTPADPSAVPPQPEHIQSSVGYEPLTVYPQTPGPPPPTGPQTKLHLVNQRGTGQFGAAVSESDHSTVTTDGWGTVTLSVTPGEVLRFTRDPTPPSFCSPPEGNGIGVRYTVPRTPQSEATITLPNATGPSFRPGLSSAERWVIGRINRLRTARHVPPLMISETLDRAADATAHDAALLKARRGHYPWPPAHCDVIAQDWGWPTHGGIGAEDAATTSAAVALAHWTDSSARERTTLDPNNTAVGIGDGAGAWVMEIGRCPAGADASRCVMTRDTGDPNGAHSNGNGSEATRYAAALARCAKQPGQAGAKCREQAKLAHDRAIARAKCLSIKNTKQRASCVQHANAIRR